MNQLLQRFNNLKPHEQLMLAGCAAVIGLYLIYVMLWSPLRESQARLSQQNTVAREALLSVQTLAAEHKQLIAAGASAKSRSGGNLSRIVDASVASNNLAMRRYQPSSGGGAQVRFENVPYSNMLGWIYELESEHGVLVKDLSFTNGNASGLVNVSIRLDQVN